MPALIELAPEWKTSLTLDGPLILASGAMSAAGANAIVTHACTAKPRGGASGDRVFPVPGGFLLRTGGANAGLANLVHEHRRAWEASPVPIILALAAQGARDWPEMAMQLERVPGIRGIELHLNPTFDAAGAIRATRAATELPLLAKLDLDQAVEIAPACITAGANALVVGRPPRGMTFVNGRAWFGRLYSPAIRPLVLEKLDRVAALGLGVPLIACGGIQCASDVREFLAAGACAVEIDSAQWIEPQIVARLATEINDQPV